MNTKLSILMMTYNQGHFIAEAIESVLSQRLNISWELVIGDDCSDDDTANIVSDFVMDNSNIQYFRHDVNIGLHANYIFLLSQTKGNYVALLEADDIWLDPTKCQQQIDFLEANPEVSWCFTNGNIVGKNGEIIEKVRHNLPRKFDLPYYLSHFFNPLNNTIIFRRNAEPSVYPDFFYGIVQWDTVLNYLRSFNGSIGFLPIVGLAWRRHETATSTTLFYSEKRYEDWIKINRGMYSLVGRELKPFFKNNFKAYEYLALYNFKTGKKFRGCYFLLFMLWGKPFRSFTEYRDLVYKLRHDS